MSGPGFLRDSLGEDEHLWIAARPNSAGRFPPGSLNSAGQPPWAPGNRCGLIRGEDVIIYMPVVCVCVCACARACMCVFSYCKCRVLFSHFQLLPCSFRPLGQFAQGNTSSRLFSERPEATTTDVPPHTHTTFILDNREVNHSCLFHHLRFLSLSLS